MVVSIMERDRGRDLRAMEEERAEEARWMGMEFLGLRGEEGV